MDVTHILEATLDGDPLSATTATVLVATPDPACMEANVTLTATVTGDTTPTGTVNFYDDGELIGSATLTAGVAVLVVTALTLGAHLLLAAVYEGDDTHDASDAETTITIIECGDDFNPDCPPSEIVICPPAVVFPTMAEMFRMALPNLGAVDLPAFAMVPEVCEPCDAAGPALALVLTPTGRTLEIGDTLQMTTVVTQGQKSYQPANGLEYCSSDSDILTVSAHGGLVTAIGPGTATVSVTWHGLYARADVRVS